MVNQEQTSLSWLHEEINSSVFNNRHHASRFKSPMQKLWWGMGHDIGKVAVDLHVEYDYSSL